MCHLLATLKSLVLARVVAMEDWSAWGQESKETKYVSLPCLVFNGYCSYGCKTLNLLFSLGFVVLHQTLRRKGLRNVAYDHRCGGDQK